MPTHYEKLHVTENAPAEVIRASYRALSLKHHPDKAGDRPQSKHRMQAINDAYAVLCDTEKRKAYDALLLNERRPGRTPTPPPAPGSRHQLRRSEPPPDWLVRLFLFVSDARIAVPLVALIWLIILWVAYRK